jgi:GNAT superfamily N-acetyltransferase
MILMPQKPQDHYGNVPLTAILDRIADGKFPPADGRMTILPLASSRYDGVLSFTAHAVIFTEADPAWVHSQLKGDSLAAPLSARFLHALGERTGKSSGSIDVVTLAEPLSGQPPIELTPEADPEHPRIARALHYRDDVRAWQGDGGVVLLGRGVGGRWETAIEVDGDRRGEGIGRKLAIAARHLVPGGAPLWAQIAPGNAASVRAFLAAGFRPVGAEVLLTPGLPELSGPGTCNQAAERV